MRITVILIGLLVAGSGTYLYIVQLPTPMMEQVIIATTHVSGTVNDSMCTSTACMKNLEVSPSVQKISHTPAVKKYTEFVSPSGFVHSEPFALADYIGKKIILVEFITYSCINCQRTFPYLQQWHEMYAQDGLLVIGIHTPEFAYERDRDNVIAAMQQEGVTFPIVQDNEYQTWNAYANRFWPHRYVIDYDGNIVFDHIGEGEYAETEAVIQKLLQTKPTSV